MFRKINSQIDLLRQGMPCLYNEIIYLKVYIEGEGGEQGNPIAESLLVLVACQTLFGEKTTRIKWQIF